MSSTASSVTSTAYTATKHKNAGCDEDTDLRVICDGHGSSLEVLGEQVDDRRQVVQQEVRRRRRALSASLGRQKLVETVEE